MVSFLDLIKRILHARPLYLIKGLFFRVYGIIKTRRLSTRTHGFFKIYNHRKCCIGKRCSINTGVIFLCHTNIIIEDDVTLSQRVMLLDAGLDLKAFITDGKKPHIGSCIHIKNGAWIGAGSIILSGVTIGEYSVVGAGSVVTKNIEPFTLAVGNPCRMIKKIEKNILWKKDDED